MTRCGHDQNCSKVIETAGCSKVVKCAPPSLDPCQFESAHCWDVQPGESCELRCRYPYKGKPVQAVCPEGNTDPAKQLEWDKTQLYCECSDPPVIPAGYVKTPWGGWVCNVGYVGTAVSKCGADLEAQECRTETDLLGCDALVPCAPLSKSSPNVTCAHDLSNCSGVMPGQSCTVRCKAPFVPNGTASIATCPGRNTDPKQELTWLPPVCTLPCPKPLTSLPPGYTWNDEKSEAECGFGYVGPAITTCTWSESNCIIKTTVSGCSKLQNCSVPYVDTCMHNSSDCHNIPAGRSCLMRCEPPYSGNPTAMICPWNNTDPTSPLQWSAPTNCSIPVCADPNPRPIGYRWQEEVRMKGKPPEPAGWRCEKFGYIGEARKVCTHTRDINQRCEAVGLLRGCDSIIPCGQPVLSDTCMYDVSLCSSTQPGSYCEVRCRPPYVGTSKFAYCSLTNVDTGSSGLEFELPNCKMSPTFDPLPVDEGFERTIRGYQCRSGYAGDINLQCSIQPGCRTTSTPNGCAAPVTCGIHSFEDTDLREGYISGQLMFGPAQLDVVSNFGDPIGSSIFFPKPGVINEKQVHHYAIYFVDQCNVTFGDALLTVKPKLVNGSQPGCCNEKQYNVTIPPIELHPDALELAVVVEIINPEGRSRSVSYWKTKFVDYYNPTTSFARRLTTPSMSTLAVAMWIWISCLSLPLLSSTSSLRR
eukprot:TRINITY_DN12222_c0_g2_i2.p1 TRINITY_DN12222_c0_g2~~TRINITY_DN12222_c0_g2_i2.p1  ORF type:complete len:784 (+),score=63.96 TRINITY_DN12222_c0_g2_i2:258-2354(+)